MSKKSEKKNHHRKNSNVGIADERLPYIESGMLFDYLRKILSRFSGYPFISVSKSFKQGENNYVVIVVHHNMPVQDKNGNYKSDQDQYVRTVYTKDENFGGMIMDRQKNYAFGNPFKQYTENDKCVAPDLGKEPTPFAQDDESAQPL